MNRPTTCGGCRHRHEHSRNLSTCGMIKTQPPLTVGRLQAPPDECPLRDEATPVYPVETATAEQRFHRFLYELSQLSAMHGYRVEGMVVECDWPDGARYTTDVPRRAAMLEMRVPR